MVVAPSPDTLRADGAGLRLPVAMTALTSRRRRGMKVENRGCES